MSDNKALDMFVIGSSVRNIAQRLGRSEEQVEAELLGSIKTAAKARAAVDGVAAPLILAERIEALLRVMMPKALSGGDDAIEAAEVCRRLLNHADAATPATGEDGLAAALAAGDERAALMRLRDRLAREIDAAKSPRMLASLTRQFVGVVQVMQESAPPTTNKVDEIAERRAKRQAALRQSEASN